VGLVILAGLPTFLLESWPAPATATPAPLTIAYISSLTGEAAAQYTGASAVFQAAIDAQNAAGGIHGHKLQSLVVDDQTNPTAVANGTKEAASKGVIGIVANDPIWGIGGAQASQQAGVPVTGSYSDGPEWGKQPYTNLFAADTGSVDPKYPVNTLYGKLVKLVGGTKLALYALGISPNSTQSNSNETQSVQRVDPAAKTVVDNRSVPFGDNTNFTPIALVAKDQGVNVMWSNLDQASNFALATAYRQAGVKTKAIFFPVGYDPTLIHSPTWASVQGDYFEVVFHPFYEPNAGTEQMQAALEKYAHWSKSQFPTFSQDEAWLGAELMFKGLEGAGSNPTRASVIKSLRSIKAWNGNGLLPFTVNFSTGFGHNPPAQCVWLTRAGNNGFVPVGNAPVCGTYIPGTTSLGS
jgi:branched-chain amino acid transport system substrate-binding protein